MAKEIPLHEKQVVFKHPGKDNFDTKLDLTYRQTKDGPLKMDVYIPGKLSEGERVPGVLFIHGGPLPSEFRPQLKNWGQYISFGKLIANSGLVGFTFNHRYHEYSQLEQSSRDIGAAIQYARENASSFKLDPDQICLWAISGGGPQLSLILHEFASSIQCIVAYYTILDLRHIQEAVNVLSSEVLEKTALETHLRLRHFEDIPIFIARSGLDDPKLNKTIDCFVKEATKSNIQLDFVNHAHGHHAFDVLDDNIRSREIIVSTIRFIKSSFQ
ncbi:MAG: alpha/beta hydrolase [Candidatus Thorarchaeota archaeon]